MILELDGGQRAYAYTGGKPFDAARPTVVFIHGAQHDHSAWGLQTCYFAHHDFGMLALDRAADVRCPVCMLSGQRT